MALVINTNVSSLNAQRQLMSSGSALDRATERLSSGQRVNSAKDDAAGLAIANRMTSQVRGLDQAVRNANDGVSLIQTAEGALQESTNILQRMRELAVQSSNGIYSNNDRTTLDAESKQLVSELNRIAGSTSFNGQNLLDGKLGNVKLQVGAEANQTISFKIGAMDAKTLGLGSTAADVAGTHLSGAIGSVALNDGDVLINGKSIGAVTSTTTMKDLLTQINSKIDGVTASAFNEAKADTVADGVVVSATASADITVTETDGTTSVYTINKSVSLSDFADQLNTLSSGKLNASIGTDGKLVIANNTGATIALGGDAQTATGIGATTYGQIALTSNSGNAITVTAGTNGTAAKLASLGFQETRTGNVVVGKAVNTTALAYGDVKINGVTIDHTNTATIQGKVDNINKVSDQTGVVASLRAEQVGVYDAARTAIEIEGTISTTGASVAAGDTIGINGVNVTLTAGGVAGVISAINGSTSATGVKAYQDANNQLSLFGTGPITIVAGTVNGANLLTYTGLSAGNNVSAVATAGDLNINNVNITFSALGTLSSVITNINAAQSTTGVFASLNDSGNLVLSSNAAFSVKAGATKGAQALYTLGLMGSDADPTDTETFSPSLQLTSLKNTPISIDLSTAGATNTGLIAQNVSASGAGFGSSIASVSIATQDSAQKAIKVIDNALTTINSTRANLGAVNNRLDFTVSNLSNISEKTTAARSRIVDADFATETANLSRAQVLQQAASAMLAQSNSRPQQVLSLLR